MKYRVDYTKKADKQLRNMAAPASERIFNWIDEHLEG